MKFLILVLAFVFALPASAIGLSPMGQALDQSAVLGSLRINNNTTEPKRYQVEVDTWTVGPNGEKVQTPSSDIAFYPASVITLKPGKVQTLRWKRDAVDASREQVYLVKVREIPAEDAEAVEAGAGFQLTIVPRMLLVWTFTPKGMDPQLQASRSPGHLVLENTGNATARVNNISYAGDPDPAPHVILPGERLRLKTSATATASDVRLDLAGVPQTLSVE